MVSTGDQGKKNEIAGRAPAEIGRARPSTEGGQLRAPEDAFYSVCPRLWEEMTKSAQQKPLTERMPSVCLFFSQTVEQSTSKGFAPD